MTEEEIDAVHAQMEHHATALMEFGDDILILMCVEGSEPNRTRALVAGRGNPYARDGMALRYAMNGVGD
jgi:hypothetical protein